MEPVMISVFVAMAGIVLTAIGLFLSIGKISSGVSATVAANISTVTAEIKGLSKSVDRLVGIIDHNDRRLAAVETAIAVLSARLGALEGVKATHAFKDQSHPE